MDWQPPLSPHAKDALAQTVEDYVSKDTDEYALIEELKAKHGLERVYRFDIGKNTDGYSDLIEGVLEMTDVAGFCRRNLVEYPDNHYRLLLEQMSLRFGVDPACFVITSGLECMIDHISRAFLHQKARFLLPIPNFSVFEAFSLRMGANPIYLRLAGEDGFQWTRRTVDECAALLAAQKPSLLWISNPVNPTGQDLPLAWIERLVDEAARHGAAVVVDEAYGEYTDPDYGITSAARMVPDKANLMVTRTFSKIHALPSLRVGYLMCSNPETIKALELYRPMFPFSWFSLFVAQTAFVDEEQPIKARRRTLARRKMLINMLEAMPDYQYLDSATNTIMLRHKKLAASRLWDELAARGCLTANLNGINGLIGEEFLRITIRAEADNLHLVESLRQIAASAPA